jgi:hypothetical protein
MGHRRKAGYNYSWLDGLVRENSEMSENKPNPYLPYAKVLYSGHANGELAPIAFADVRPGGGERFVAVFTRGVVGEAAVIAALAEALRFPDYFGFNWNAVDECIADLSWIAERDQLADRAHAVG